MKNMLLLIKIECTMKQMSNEVEKLDIQISLVYYN